jgi:PilZ domain
MMPTTSAGEMRAGRRSNVFLAATLVTAGRSVPVRVRNISARGALLDGSGLPTAGAGLDLRRGSLVARGEIIWQTGGECGVRFDSDIDVASWTGRVGHSGQQKVDEIVALVRRPTVADAVPRVPPVSLVPATHADSLALISADLAEACERLAARAELVTAFAEELLELDAIAQRLSNAVRDGRAD